MKAYETKCRYCGRYIIHSGGYWIDPEATGDDVVWRETCDAHDTFTAQHEPSVQQTCCDGTGWTGVEGQPCAEHYEPLGWPWFA